MAECQCRTCGGTMVQKDTVRLFVVGLAMVASPAVAAFFRFLRRRRSSWC